MSMPQPPSQPSPNPGHGSEPAPAPAPAYGSGTAPAYGSTPVPQKKSKGPKILMILGGIILLLSIIAGTVMTVIGIGNTASGLSEIQELPGGNGTITAESGDVLQLYAPEGSGPIACTIVTPDGAEPGPGTDQSSSTTMDDGQTWVSFASFEATSSGEHQISCDSTDVAVGPPVSIGGIFGAIGGVLLGILGGILGFLLLLAGLIWWLVTRKKA